MSESKELQYQLSGLKKLLGPELRFQTEALQLMGVVDTILTAATVNWQSKGGTCERVGVATRDSVKNDAKI